MCLSCDTLLTAQCENSSQQEFTCYKIFKIENNRYLCSPYQGYRWCNLFIGVIDKQDTMVIKSDRKNRILTKDEILVKKVDHGIHVFINQKDAIKEKNRISEKDKTSEEDYVVLPVVCKKEDLVAVGHFRLLSYLTGYESMVFMKVTVPINLVLIKEKEKAETEARKYCKN